MQEYPIEVIDNHITININDKKVLLDTGSPNSIGKFQNIKLLGKEYTLSDNFMGIDIFQISNFIDRDIDAMLGGDILREYYFVIDWQKRLFKLSTEQISFEGIEVLIKVAMNIPVVNIKINKKSVKTFLDTGAKISYVDPSITNKYDSIGEVTDYYPAFGQFETSIFKIPVFLAEKNIDLVFGTLPDSLQNSLMMAGTQGILGNDVFNYFSIYFELSRERIFMKEVVD